MALDGSGKRSWARRRWLMAGALGAVGTVIHASQAVETAAVEVWIDLSEPIAAGALDRAAAQQRGRHVALQQDRVGERLRELGIAEVARVRHVRNAILVRATPAQWDQLRAIPGVVRVVPATTLHPPKTTP
jgi:hypothetical protein